MNNEFLLQLVSVTALSVIDGISYSIWTYRISWSDAFNLHRSSRPDAEQVAAVRVALELSRRIPILDPSKYPQVLEIQATQIDVPATGDVQTVYRDFQEAPVSALVFAFIAPSTQDTFCAVRLLQRVAVEAPWTTLSLKVRADGAAALQQVTIGPSAVCPVVSPLPDAPVLAHATRSVLKATHVPLEIDAAVGLPARVKLSFLRQLALQPGESDAALQNLETFRSGGSQPHDLSLLSAALHRFDAFGRSSSNVPTSTFDAIAAEDLQAFGAAIVALRERAGTSVAAEVVRRTQDATAANTWLRLTSTLLPSPIGMLNLERIEMAPAGIERGELVATIPLAPGEKTAVVQKEWSVTSKEFTSIVTDSLENISETGVTDNTELAQSTASQIQHANQFNITGTVSGGIPLISGSTTAAFGAQDSSSQSATDSRKHASTVTQKASSRTKQEHKVTISTSTVTGTSETTTRELVNPSTTDPMRIDYFSMMRKWRVRLYRYGLRLTYDIVISEPAAQFRKAYAELADKKAQIAAFEFHEPHGSITESNYQQLADKYQAQVPVPPTAVPPYAMAGVSVGLNIDPSKDGSWRFFPIDFDVPPACEVSDVFYDGYVGALGVAGRELTVVGFGDIPIPSGDGHDKLDLGAFLVGATGHQTITFRLIHVDVADVQFKVSFRPTQQARDQWANDVWNTLNNAAQTQYYAKQQDLVARIADLESRLVNVDTLTLRREENDEIMKGALRFLLGVSYEYMNDVVDSAAKASGDADPEHGIAFTDHKVGINALQLFAVSDYESEVRFINQAIEWENVVTFLYSYFWDMPESWDFIRQIQHPDATRQAFLRAGSARVVLTVRKGWESAWLSYVDGIAPGQQTPRLTIAQEIAAYDDRNYPGIPPANPGRSATRLQDAVYTTSTTELPSPGATLPMFNVPIDVESSDGFIVGANVLIDTGVHLDDSFGWQESTTIVGMADKQITVASILYEHGGDGAAYAVVQPGEAGVLIAEWNEYTPTSGTDIAVTSNLASIA